MHEPADTPECPRVLALWCPDWPAIAAAAEIDLSPDRPVAVFENGRVRACNAAARAVGVRRGMRKRESQAISPELHVAIADAGRNARIFEPVVAGVIETIPFVEVLRPGLLVMSAAGAARYFGGMEIAAERLIDAVSVHGAESSIGVADQLFTAVTAARRGQIVPENGDAEFLAPLPIAELASEPSLCAEDRGDLVDLLYRLGIRRIGDFARLSPADVATRFGADAIAAHRVARAVPDRPPSGQPLPPDLVVEHQCDPPVDRVDAAAFIGRMLSVELHAALSAASVACTRLIVTAKTETGQECSRVWRCAEPLTPEATADRVRWQLDGWLTGKAVRGVGDRPDSPIVTLRLEPVEVVDSAALQMGLGEVGLGGTDPEGAQRAKRALMRVQGLLGGAAVQVPIRSGGTGPAQQVTMIPLGDEQVPDADPEAPWPARLPQPAPAVLMSQRVQITDPDGRPVRVTGRGGFSSEPSTLSWGSRSWDLEWWAGPWPTDERWWAPDGGGPAARAQVLLDDSRALLLHFAGQGWSVEGVYE
ncbi:DNA polymerase Y family protein [Jongsikchunia kroppenstedtii]|uniref:DNA polymerase Y family protein n=1 Tax=Jongsikchunia kroppenstedtii TaxID=1121721 RepID=UPI000475EF5A|nr:DNA polymerase Y family protein [Jongsikchunia kroppenstedtii]